MSAGQDERRLPGEEAASNVQQTNEPSTSLAYETPSVVDGAPARIVFDAQQQPRDR